MLPGLQFGTDSSVASKGPAWISKWFAPVSNAPDFDKILIDTMAASGVKLDTWDQDVQWSSLQDFAFNGSSTMAQLAAEQAYLASRGVSPGMLLYDSSSATDAIFNGRVLSVLRLAYPMVVGRRFEVLSARPVPLNELPDTVADNVTFPMTRVLKNVGTVLNNPIYLNLLHDLSLSCTSVKQNAAIGTVVGTITNGEVGSTFSVTDGTGHFVLVNGNQIATSAALPTLTTYTITVIETKAGFSNSPRSSPVTIEVVGLSPVIGGAWLDICPDVPATLNLTGSLVNAIAGNGGTHGLAVAAGTARASLASDGIGSYLQFTAPNGYAIDALPDLTSGYTMFEVMQVSDITATYTAMDFGLSTANTAVNRVSFLHAGTSGYLHRRADNTGDLASASQGTSAGNDSWHIASISADANPSQAFAQIDQQFFDSTSFAGRFAIDQTGWDTATYGWRNTSASTPARLVGNKRRSLIYLSNLSLSDTSRIINQLIALYGIPH